MKNEKPYHVGEWRMSRKNHLKGSMIFIYDVKESFLSGIPYISPNPFYDLYVRGFIDPKKPKEWCGKKIIDSDGFNYKYKPTPYQVYERLTKFLGEKVDLKYAILKDKDFHEVYFLYCSMDCLNHIRTAQTELSFCINKTYETGLFHVLSEKYNSDAIVISKEGVNITELFSDGRYDFTFLYDRHFSVRKLLEMRSTLNKVIITDKITEIYDQIAEKFKELKKTRKEDNKTNINHLIIGCPARVKGKTHVHADLIKVGDCFKHKNGQTYSLTEVNIPWLNDSCLCALSDLVTGTYFSNPIMVNNKSKISNDEVRKLMNNETEKFTRIKS